MAVDVDALRRLLEEAVPFLKRIGFVIKSLGEDGVRLELPWRNDNANHVGTAHAGVIFTVGETAGGALVSTAFDLGRYVLVVRGAKISYRRPVKGLLTCTGKLDPEAVKAASERAQRDGKTTMPIRLELFNEKDELAAEMELEYHLRRIG